jgi:hypothetical protein
VAQAIKSLLYKPEALSSNAVPPKTKIKQSLNLMLAEYL